MNPKDKLTYVYVGDAGFTKNADGTLTIEGTVTSDSLDSDGQICDAKWLESVIPKWAEIGNMREMHDKIAAGIGLELSQEGSKWKVKSLCVDPVTCLKWETGVLKGHSIGIRNARIDKSAAALAKAPGGVIVGGSVPEISYVDRGSNFDANDAVIVKVAKLNKRGTDEIDVEMENVDVVDPPIAALKTFFTDLAKSFTEQVDALPKNSVEVQNWLAERGVGEALIEKDGVTPLHDPAMLQQTLDNLVTFISTELSELTNGENEIWDIEDLICAMRIFVGWWKSEAWEGETIYPFNAGGPDMDDLFIGLGVSAEIHKRATSPEATDEDKAALRVEAIKSLGVDTLIATAVKTATDGQSQVIEGLKTELARVSEMANKQYGPKIAAEAEQVRTRTKRDELILRIDELETLAGDKALSAEQRSDVLVEVAHARTELSKLSGSAPSN